MTKNLFVFAAKYRDSATSFLVLVAADNEINAKQQVIDRHPALSHGEVSQVEEIDFESLEDGYTPIYSYPLDFEE